MQVTLFISNGSVVLKCNTCGGVQDWVPQPAPDGDEHPGLYKVGAFTCTNCGEKREFDHSYMTYTEED